MPATHPARSQVVLLAPDETSAEWRVLCARNKRLRQEFVKKLRHSFPSKEFHQVLSQQPPTRTQPEPALDDILSELLRQWLLPVGMEYQEQLRELLESAGKAGAAAALAAWGAALALHLTLPPEWLARLHQQIQEALLPLLNTDTVARDINRLVQEGITSGATPDTMEENILDFIQSHVEDADQDELYLLLKAWSLGALFANQLLNAPTKSWITRQDKHVCGMCAFNEGQGPIPIDDPFDTGASFPPAHPRCRCRIQYHDANRAALVELLS